MAKLDISYLELIFKKIIKDLRSEGVAELNFEDDLYWVVPSEAINDFSKDPELFVGSVEDDVAYLKLVIDENLVSYYSELERISAVLRFISKLRT